MGGSLLRFAWIALLLLARLATGQNLVERDAALADRPMSLIRIEGADAPDEQLIRNNIRAVVGDPYDAQVVRDDVNRIYSLGRFAFVTAEAQLGEDGTVIVLYSVTVQPPISAVQTIGNRAIPDEQLRAIVRQVPGGPRDRYLIEKAKRDIKALYRKKGYYLTEVSIDESQLAERGILIFNIIEGPRVRVKVIEFDGVDSFPVKRVQAEIKTRTSIPLLRAGVLDQDVLVTDANAVVEFYRDRGHLDVRVGHSIQLSPDNTEAKVIFHVSEGRQYTLGSVRVQLTFPAGDPPTLFTSEQIAALLEMKTGDVYSREALLKSIKVVEDAYGMLGYLDVRVDASELRSGPDPVVDLQLDIEEGRLYRVGLIRINGNFLTRDRVVRRLMRLQPGRPYDTVGLQKSEDLVRNTRLFNDVRITIQQPDPVDSEFRDLLVEVKERNTGSVNFGVAVGSDSGVFGDFSVNQSNFDIADFPESFEEWFSGRAFRGAGQQFSLAFRPGDEIFQYSVSLTEPHLFDSDYALTTAGIFLRRDYDQYDEKRATASVSLSRRLGDVWQIGYRTRYERVELTDISIIAPTAVFADAGPDTLQSVGIVLTRTTLDTFRRPGRGSRLNLSIDYFTGDFDFFNTSLDYTVYLTLDEDLLGRKTTLRLRSRLGYIFGPSRVPTYERYYLGGRSFRGFDFREISPKGTLLNGEPSSDPVGGTWMAFLGAQYEFPLFQESISGVVFVDSGTVTNTVGFDDYRVSAGFGVRLNIPALGPVPIAFDFGWPIRKQDLDDERVLSFSAELPF
ncbi:MAG: BamA/TamA family outer membrane protein [Planctomycetes bacterium]|nr:BamA/TamA family outer membrane protein [Planctomycetota bacterium]